jgi:threonine dehydrogenase-like Zn-dependent dehydrogenase
VADTIDARLTVARELGADTTIEDTEDAEPLEPADVVIVTRSSPAAVSRAVRWCAAGGRVLAFGVAQAGATAAIEPQLLWRREVSVIGTRSYTDTFAPALELLVAGQVRARPIVSRTVGLAEVPGVLRESAGLYIKTVIVPGA